MSIDLNTDKVDLGDGSGFTATRNSSFCTSGCYSARTQVGPCALTENEKREATWGMLNYYATRPGIDIFVPQLVFL